MEKPAKNAETLKETTQRNLERVRRFRGLYPWNFPQCRFVALFYSRVNQLEGDNWRKDKSGRCCKESHGDDTTKGKNVPFFWYIFPFTLNKLENETQTHLRIEMGLEIYRLISIGYIFVPDIEASILIPDYGPTEIQIF